MRRCPGSKARLIAAALGLLAAPMLADQALAQARMGEDLAAVHDRCVRFVQSNPKEGLERAKVWKEQGGGFYADHCIAMALFQLRDYAAAAERFETLATAMLGMPATERAQALDQAGQAWLDAHQPERAKAAFDAAIQINGEEVDLLIDRAEAWAEMKRYWDALDDLNRAIDIAPTRADAYIYRGTAYRNLDSLDLAMQDIEHGLSLAPNSPMGLLERGNLRRLKGDIAGARRDWLRVSELAPKTAEDKAARLNLANLKGKGEADKAPSTAKQKTP